MELFLVRHAEAVELTEAQQDSVRWLTAKGRKAMKRGAGRLRKKRVRPDLIVTSPLTRAVQTAELLLPEMGKQAELVADSSLATDGTVAGMLECIQQHPSVKRLMLVGHEPLLSQLAATLLGRQLVNGFSKGSCLALELRSKPGKPAKFIWYLPLVGKTISSVRKALVPAEKTA